MSKLEEYIVEIDGIKYVPYDKAVVIAQTNYTSTVNTLTTELTKAMSDYSDEIKKLTAND